MNLFDVVKFVVAVADVVAVSVTIFITPCVCVVIFGGRRFTLLLLDPHSEPDGPDIV